MQDYKTERILMLGRSGTGKSYSAIKYVVSLLKEGFIEAKHVVLMSATWKSDPSQKDLVDYCESQHPGWKNQNGFETIDIKFLTDLYTSQKAVKEYSPKKLHNWLIILDDQISDKIIASKDETLIKLFCVGRHFNIGMVMMLQRFRGTMNCTMRDQFTRICIFKQGNKKSLLDLLADYEESPLDHKQGLQFIYDCYADAISQDEGHGCLCINALISYGQGRLEKGLGTKLYYDGSHEASVTANSQKIQETPLKQKQQRKKAITHSSDTDEEAR